MVEKPQPEVAPSRLAVIGRYVLLPEVFAVLDAQKPGQGGEIQLTDAMAALIGRQPFHGYRFEGRRFDCGDKLGYLEAIVAMASKRGGPAARLRRDARPLPLTAGRRGDLRHEDRDDRHGLCRARVRRLLRRVRARGGLRRQGRAQDRHARGRADADLRAGPGRAGRAPPHGGPADLHHRPRRCDRRGRGGVHRRRHALAPRRRPCRPELRLRRRGGDRGEPEASHPGGHQVDRAGRHGPQAAEDLRHAAAGPDDRRRLEPRVPARGLGDRGLPAPRPGGVRGRERSCPRRALPAATGRST